MRGFGGGRRSSESMPRDEPSSALLAGYRVRYALGNREQITALPNPPGESLKVDPQTLQIIALSEHEPPYGHQPPQFSDCNAAYVQKEDDRAREVCGWLAERGDAGSQNKLANLLFDGRGGPRSVREALRWDKLGAEQDHPRSMNNLGYMYENAQGVPRDTQQALYWYTRSAQEQDVFGLTSLARMYEKGIGVAPDMSIAAENYRRAAQGGHANAQNGLGTLYETGRGVPQSDAEAMRWYEAAAGQGDKPAQRNLDRLLGQRGRPTETFVVYPSVTYALPSEQAIRTQTVPVVVPVQAQAAPPPSKAAELARALPPAARPNPNGIAILIGNQKYDHRDINPVSYASNDVELMRQYVSKTLGYEQVKVLNGASKGDMESYFGNRDTPAGLLSQWVKPGETEVFIYYSGHGAPGLQDKRGYLLPRDANPATVPITGFQLDVLYENLAKLNAKKVTVVLEACFSGMSAGGTLIARSSGLVIKPVLPAGAAENMLIISASGADQVASWDEAAHLGLMTRHFIEGVTGAADTNKDSRVSSVEIQGYLTSKVPVAARMHYDREQHPTIIGASTAPM
jgi:TPR repeat protein